MSTASLVLLHTCEVPGVVAATHAGELVAEPLGARGPGTHTVLGAVQRCFAKLGIGLAAMQGVLVTTGPGSFTGIRVGIATAQGLASARGWQALFCDALVLDAWACAPAAGPVAVVHDARRGEVYVGLYDVSGRVPVPVLPAFCAAPEAARARLQAAAPAGGVCVGSGASLVGLPSPAWQPHQPLAAEIVARSAFMLAAYGGCASVDPLALEPFYLRLPDIGRKR